MSYKYKTEDVSPLKIQNIFPEGMLFDNDATSSIFI